MKYATMYSLVILFLIASPISVGAMLELRLEGSIASSSEVSTTLADDHYPHYSGLVQTIPQSPDPLNYFVENKGALSNDEVILYSNDIYFLKSKIIHRVLDRSPEKTILMIPKEEPSSPMMQVYMVEFIGANPTTPIGMALSSSKVTQFHGRDPHRWSAGARTYQEVWYQNLYL
jgi:hypothetical protein